MSVENAAMDATSGELSGDESLDSMTEQEVNDSDETLDQDSDSEEGQETRDRSERQKKDAKPKTPAKPTPKKLADADLDAIVTVKVDGQVKEMSVREVMKLQALEQASQKRMEEAAHERRRAAQLMHLAKTNPDKFFELTGIDADQFAEARLAKKYELSQMTPEERELHEFREQKKQSDQTVSEQKNEIVEKIEAIVGSKAPDKFKELPLERLQEILKLESEKTTTEQTSLDNEIKDAWQESGFPKHKLFVQWMAATMRNHQLRTKEPLHAKEAAAIVKKDFLATVPQIFADMDPEGIRNVLGDEILKRIRNHEIARVTGRKPNSDDQRRQGPGNAASQKPQKSKAMNETEYREYMKTLAASLSEN